MEIPRNKSHVAGNAPAPDAPIGTAPEAPTVVHTPEPAQQHGDPDHEDHTED